MQNCDNLQFLTGLYFCGLIENNRKVTKFCWDEKLVHLSHVFVLDPFCTRHAQPPESRKNLFPFERAGSAHLGSSLRLFEYLNGNNFYWTFFKIGKNHINKFPQNCFLAWFRLYIFQYRCYHFRQNLHVLCTLSWVNVNQPWICHRQTQPQLSSNNAFHRSI